MRYIILLLLLSSTLTAQTKLRQIERSATKWHVPAAWDSIPGVTGHAMKYIDLETLMDTVGIQQFGIDSLDYRNDSLLIWVGGGYYFAIIPQGLSGSGDDGSVAYWHQDTIAGDTAHFWDRTNKRLGLNTKTPSSLLHVKKNEYALPVAEFDNPGTNGQTVLIKHGASSDARYPLTIQTPAATSYFDARGYLGLGVSPSYPLHVKNASGISRFENTNTNGDAGFDLYHASKQWRIAMNAEGGTTNNVYFRDVTGSRYPITLQSSNGYVGILNLTPARELHVTGRVRVSTLDSDLTPPTTAGPTKMVITDESGDLSFANIPSGGGIDSTNIVGGWGIESTESPANTFNLIADSTQVASQYDLTLKQDKLTLTTTGTSGAATLVGSTLNVPQYQSVLTNPVTGTGTTNRVSKFTGTSTIGNSQLYDDASTVGIGALNSSYKFYVNSGNMKLGDNVVANSLNKLYFGDGTFVYVGEDVADDRLYLRGGTLSINTAGSLGTNGQVLTSNGTTASWQTPSTGSGTVTSVGVNVGTGLTVTASGNNPITTSGTFTLGNTANLTLTNTSNPTINTNTAGAVSGIQLVGSNGITISGNTNTKVVTITGSGGGTTPQTWGDFTTNIQVWNSTGTYGSGKDVGIGRQPTRDFDVYGTSRLDGPLYSTSNSPGSAGDVLTSNGVSAWTWQTPLIYTYGQMSVDGNNSSSLTTTYSKIDFATSVSNNTTVDVATNETITVPSSGTYEISYNVSFQSSVAQRYQFRVHVNGTSSARSQVLIDPTDVNDFYTVAKTYIVSLNANDSVDLRLRVGTGGTNATGYYEAPILLVKRIK